MVRVTDYTPADRLPKQFQYPIKVQEVIAKNPEKPPQDMMKIFKHLPRDAVRIAARMLVLDPDERPTPRELLQDPYFADLAGMQDMTGAPTELHDFAFSDMKRVRREPSVIHASCMFLLPGTSY